MNLRRRHLVIAGSALAHAGLMLLLFRAPSAAPAAVDVGVISVSMIDGPALAPALPAAPPQARPPVEPPPPEPAPPEPSPPEPLPAVPLDLVAPADIPPRFVEVDDRATPAASAPDTSDPVALSVMAASSGAPGQACQLSQWLQTALQADPRVQAALLQIPRRDRSVANALMLWNGAWASPRPDAAAGVAVIRGAVINGIAAAPPACLKQPLRGPELFLLADATGATLVAIGSGEWRWADVLEPGPRPVVAQVTAKVRREFATGL